MRLYGAVRWRDEIIISIHASIKDATNTSNSRSSCITYFNPRIHKGCDASFGLKTKKHHHFNPRIHKGCDVSALDIFVWSCISIHASIKDATRQVTFSRHVTNISIHASIKDATDPDNWFWYYVHISIHASIKDATSRNFSMVCSRLFQSTHP